MWMKILSVYVFCVIVFKSEVSSHLCSSNEDCTQSKCCVSFLRPDGESQPWAKNKLHLKSFKGKCRPSSRIGAGCNQFTVFPNDDRSLNFNQCPCAKDMYCEDQNVKAPEGYVGICAMRPTPCQNSSMCKDKECCVSDYGEVGDNMSSGKCQPMGIATDKCLLSNPSGRPEGMVPYACPCKENHVCAEVDVIPARFGSIGKCVSTADMLTVDTHDIDESD